MEQETNNEKSIEQESKDPTLQELVDVCREVLSQEDCDELATMDFDEALNNAITMFEDQEIDWIELLTEKGILQQES